MNQTDRNAGGGEIPPIDLYNFIVSDLNLQREVLAIAKSIVPYVDSLISAMLILGCNTVREIATSAVLDLGINAKLTGPAPS